MALWRDFALGRGQTDMIPLGCGAVRLSASEGRKGLGVMGPYWTLFWYRGSNLPTHPPLIKGPRRTKKESAMKRFNLETQCWEEEEQKIHKDIRALELLQMEYRGEIELTHTQRRAAIECLPFERPKLGAIATASMNGQDSASMLERAIERSGKAPLMIEAKAVDTPKP